MGDEGAGDYAKGKSDRKCGEAEIGGGGEMVNKNLGSSVEKAVFRGRHAQEPPRFSARFQV